jgi:hypothetical protein
VASVQNPLHHSIDLSSGWARVGPNKWTCTFCRDGVAHEKRHQTRHLNSKRHKQTIEYLSQVPLLINEDEIHEHDARSSDAILNVGVLPPTVDDITAEVCMASICAVLLSWRMAFTLADGFHRMKM